MDDLIRPTQPFGCRDNRTHSLSNGSCSPQEERTPTGTGSCHNRYPMLMYSQSDLLFSLCTLFELLRAWTDGVYLGITHVDFPFRVTRLSSGCQSLLFSCMHEKVFRSWKSCFRFCFRSYAIFITKIFFLFTHI